MELCAGKGSDSPALPEPSAHRAVLQSTGQSQEGLPNANEERSSVLGTAWIGRLGC